MAEYSEHADTRCLAFVLGGGGARGALQVGALRALWEAGLRPDLLVGTSAGGANATYLALHGFSEGTLSSLEEAWRRAAEADLLPANYLWLTVRVLFSRMGIVNEHRFRRFFLELGVTPELRFGQLVHRAILVAADLHAGRPVLYGQDPAQSVLEGLLATTALPPWSYPLVKENGELLIDGGLVSNVPIEPALAQGATEVIALDLVDPRPIEPLDRGFGPFVIRVLTTVELRQIELELELAEVRGVKVRRIPLRGKKPIPVWDFTQVDALFKRGYDLATRAIASWK